MRGRSIRSIVQCGLTGVGALRGRQAVDGGSTSQHSCCGTLVTQINRATTLWSLHNPKMVPPERQPRLARAGRTLNRLKSRRYCRDMLRKRKRTCIIGRDFRGVKRLFEARQLRLMGLKPLPAASGH